MDYSDYSFSATTQAAFFKAESELLRLDNRLAHSPFTKNLQETLLAIDAAFAVHMSHDVVLPVVPLITAHSLIDWKWHGDVERSVHARCSAFQFPEDSIEAAQEALRYMQAIDWISENITSNSIITIDTVLCLHEILLSGKSNDNRYHGFRRKVLPHKKGFEVAQIPSATNDLCSFINTESFSPLGQASVIHHAFERIVPFDSMIDRTGLILAFLSMFKRGVFANGYMAPICWGAAINKDRRKRIKDASRNKHSIETYENYREYWAVHNAQNTYYATIITGSFFDTAGRLRTKWRSQLTRVPANSALDKLLDLFLAVPGLSTGRASVAINKSYGATNEAMHKLSQAGIIREIFLDDRERVFICDQSVTMINEFVDKLLAIKEEAENNSSKNNDLSWELESMKFIAHKRK